jgi:hypothetical protein
MIAEGKLEKQEIARVLKLSPQRMAPLLSGKRKLSHDEACVLVEKYGFEDPSALIESIVTKPILALAVQYVLQELAPGGSPDPDHIEDIVQDVEAFLRYAADPQVRDNIEMAGAFFLARKAIRREVRPAASVQ